MHVAWCVFTRSLLSIKRLYETVKCRRRATQSEAKSVKNDRRRKVGAAGGRSIIGHVLLLLATGVSAQSFIE